MTSLQREKLISEVEQFVAELQQKLATELDDFHLELREGEHASMPDVTFKFYSRQVEALMDFRSTDNGMKVDVYILHGKGETSDLDEDHFETDRFDRILVYCMKAIGYHQASGEG